MWMSVFMGEWLSEVGGWVWRQVLDGMRGDAVEGTGRSADPLYGLLIRIVSRHRSGFLTKMRVSLHLSICLKNTLPC